MEQEFEERRRALFARRRRIIAAVLVAVIGFTAFFVYRSVERTRYWREHADQPIRGWMSIRYVARSHRVRPQVLEQALGLSGRDQRPLAKIAHDQNRELDDLILAVEQAIAEERLRNPPPVPGGSP